MKVTTSGNNSLLGSVAGVDAETEALLERIHEIGPLLRENAPIADRDRRLPDVSIEAVESTGAFAISTLKQHGGYEGSVRMLFEAVQTLGYYCPSSGWVTAISNGGVLLQNRWPESVRQRVYADDKPVKMAAIFLSPRGSAVRADNGYRISGEWPFASNIYHADWTIALMPVTNSADAEPQAGLAIVKRGEYSIKDTWFTVGMRGTGSNSMVVEDLWIPEDQMVLADHVLGPAAEADPNASVGQRLAMIPVLTVPLAAAAVGAARAAVDYVGEQSRTRPMKFSTYPTRASSAAFVEGLGHVAMKIDSATLHLRRSADTIDRHAREVTPLPDLLRARTLADVGHCGFQLADALNDLMSLHGTAAFAESSPLAQLWRDVNTATRHQVLSALFNYEVYGDGLLGLPYVTTLL